MGHDIIWHENSSDSDVHVSINKRPYCRFLWYQWESGTLAWSNLTYTTCYSSFPICISLWFCFRSKSGYDKLYPGCSWIVSEDPSCLTLNGYKELFSASHPWTSGFTNSPSDNTPICRTTGQPDAKVRWNCSGCLHWDFWPNLGTWSRISSPSCYCYQSTCHHFVIKNWCSHKWFQIRKFGWVSNRLWFNENGAFLAESQCSYCFADHFHRYLFSIQKWSFATQFCRKAKKRKPSRDQKSKWPVQGIFENLQKYFQKSQFHITTDIIYAYPWVSHQINLVTNSTGGSLEPSKIYYH